MPNYQRVLEKCQEVVEKGNRLYEKYKVDLSKANISFDLKGRCAGMAHHHRNGDYEVRFNRNMVVGESIDTIVDDTVPHEYGHIACFMARANGHNIGWNHDEGWRQICIALGGSGERCHEEPVIFGKGKTYEYVSTTGHAIRLSEQHHARVQCGTTLRVRGKGSITASCSYTVVGVRGQSLVNPIMKRIVDLVTPHSTNTGEGRVLVPAVAIHDDPVAIVTGLPVAIPGEKKAATSRRIMLHGLRHGSSYEKIIELMMSVCGYNRQLARQTFKANAAKVGIPDNFC